MEAGRAQEFGLSRQNRQLEMTPHPLAETLRRAATELAAAPLTPEEAAHVAAGLGPLLQGLRALDDLVLRDVEPALILSLDTE